jgi:hypothetical protein
MPTHPHYAASDLLIGARQIAHAFNRSEDTIRRWCREGFIPHKRLPDNTIVSSVSAISAWIAEGEAE